MEKSQPFFAKLIGMFDVMVANVSSQNFDECHSSYYVLELHMRAWSRIFALYHGFLGLYRFYYPHAWAPLGQ